MAHTNSNIKKSEKELAMEEKGREIHKEEIKKLQKGTADLEDLHAKGRESSGKLKLDDTELTEYFQIEVCRNLKMQVREPKADRYENDGILLTESGTMTGGTSAGMEASLKQWDDKKIEGVKKKKEQLESELEELGSIREMQIKESETAGRTSRHEKNIQHAELEKTFVDLCRRDKIRLALPSGKPESKGSPWNW